MAILLAILLFFYRLRPTTYTMYTSSDQPYDGDLPYPLPSIPSANVLFAESYKTPAPAPPVLSSNTEDDDGLHPMLGSTAQGMVTLWNKCTSSSDNNSDTCKKIRTV